MHRMFYFEWYVFTLIKLCRNTLFQKRLKVFLPDILFSRMSDQFSKISWLSIWLLQLFSLQQTRKVLYATKLFPVHFKRVGAKWCYFVIDSFRKLFFICIRQFFGNFFLSTFNFGGYKTKLEIKYRKHFVMYYQT